MKRREALSPDKKVKVPIRLRKASRELADSTE